MRFTGTRSCSPSIRTARSGSPPGRSARTSNIVWRYQYEKFRRDPIWGMKSYHRQGGDPDTKLYLIPFQKVGGWLYTIHPSRLLGYPQGKAAPL